MEPSLRESTPDLWLAIVCAWWGGSRALAEYTWQGLLWSQAPGPNDFWRWILWQTVVDVQAFSRRYAPQTVVAVLERLVAEARVGRVYASQLEELILAQVDARGDWRAVPR